MKTKKYLGLSLCALLVIASSGCSTLQQPITFNQLGNFSTYQLNEQAFRISVKTSSRMSYGTTQEITLVKAAQTAIQHGFSAFKILNDPSSANQPPRQAVVYNTPAAFRPYGFYGPRSAFFWNDYFDDSAQVVNVEPNEVTYSIVCYKNTQTLPNDAFDARLILKSLGAKYGVAENGDILKPEVQKTS